MNTMKRTVAVIILFFCFSTFQACKDSGSPESITELFLISLNKLDYTTLNSISTKNTKSILKIMKALTEEKINPKEMEKRGENFEVEILETTPIDDSTVVVKFKTNPTILPMDKIQLVKVVEKLDKVAWKVNISTVDLMEAEDKELPKTQGERTSEDGQLHPDADSIAVEE